MPSLVALFFTRHRGGQETLSFYSVRSYSFAEYWIRFMARFDDVYVSGYNSTRSKPIWMKFGALGVHCFAAGPGIFWVTF